jgi:UDP-N-acetylmuramoylalanine--D-glutamate ligase
MTSNLEEAITQARQEAVTGGVVLYSPAATSFDMFRDYEHRGRTFKTLVNALEASLP